MRDSHLPLLHDDPEDHWHLEDLDMENTTVEDIDGIESFRQQSVGIDIGSSTSHLIFSELILRRDRSGSRFSVAGRRMLHQSAILLTPYMSPTQIDAERLQSFIERTYEAAGVSPEDIDAGAVVITGEALMKENARPILEMFSRQAGKFICASAGPNHEALLAAHGSGAVALSKDNKWKVLVVDMGGGTTKLALIDAGQVLQTAAINIGARLVAFDENNTLTRIEPPAHQILGDGPEQLALSVKITPATKELLVERMADSLFEIVEGRAQSELTTKLMITPPLSRYGGLQDIDRIIFSGGVSEYVYGRDDTSYGDLGPLLGHEIRHRLSHLNRPDLLAPSVAGIRATVIGAGEYTIQASGNTSHIANKDLLPVYALQVVRPETSRPEELTEAVDAALKLFDLDAYTNGLALALSLTEDDLTYPHLRKVADAIAAVAKRAASDVKSMFVVLDKDVAKSLGAILKEEVGFPLDLIAIDGIDVGDLDFVDIGRPMGTSEVLPVTVKSLIFPTRVQA